MVSQQLYRKSKFSLLAFLAVLAASCSHDDDVAPGGKETGKDFNPYILTLAIQGNDQSGATSYSFYNVPFEDIMEGDLDAVHRGTENEGTYNFTQVDQTIFAMSMYDKLELEGIRKNKNSRKTELFDKITVDKNIVDLRQVDDETMLSVAADFGGGTLKFIPFDLNSTDAQSDPKAFNIKDHPELGPIGDDEGIDYSGVQISGDRVFISYYIVDPETYETHHIDTARVAVLSYPDLEFEKVIKDTRVGPIGGFESRAGLVKDEDGNIYAVSHSNQANGYMYLDSDTPKPSGILKINTGETEFDEDYFFKIDEEANGGNTAHLNYLKDGKAFAEINTAPREEQEYLSDEPLRSAVLDLENQEVHFIDNVPEHPGEGRPLAALYEDPYIYMAIREEGDLHVYQMDTGDYTAKKGAHITASFVAGFFRP